MNALGILLINHISLSNLVFATLNLDKEFQYIIFQHDPQFTKQYFSGILPKTNQMPSFISSTLNVFQYDLIMNAYRSMLPERRNYFINQLTFEESNFTHFAKAGTDKLIMERQAFISHQAKNFAASNYLKVLKTFSISNQAFDVQTQGYNKPANTFLDKYVQSPQTIARDNCTIGFVSTVGVQAKWKYPFRDEGNFMKAEGQFNFAHDLNLKVDILQIPFKGEEMLLTIVISRRQEFYTDVRKIFEMAYLGEFRVQIQTVYLPKIAYSIIIKEFSPDAEHVPVYNKYRCMTQKMVVNFNEQGIGTSIHNQPKNKDFRMNDWNYGSDYYSSGNSCTVNSPFFFIIHYVKTQDIIFLGQWRPSAGTYIENIFNIDSTDTPSNTDERK